ncbi:4a-hydroxytetrahydrobiopterin dehydratase [Vibrio sonorensis]|uniref:4a-hydroxytetrahydrobiopterin dehydratase n=1 Tax=Vibrio sonorensis TaxID=1004316 RepID=UPI0008DA2DF6|nr:4a-hydroxytetrahydrobiopterin dehydratase [Vibrio sonorensis]
MLEELRCEACGKEATPLSSKDIELLMTEIEGWELIEKEGVPQLEKQFRFKNFKLAWDFTNKIAEMAEEEFHHPSIVLEWGSVTVTWWSHSIKGLHRNDFICAAKCDQLSP